MSRMKKNMPQTDLVRTHTRTHTDKTDGDAGLLRNSQGNTTYANTGNDSRLDVP